MTLNVWPTKKGPGVCKRIRDDTGEAQTKPALHKKVATQLEKPSASTSLRLHCHANLMDLLGLPQLMAKKVPLSNQTVTLERERPS